MTVTQVTTKESARTNSHDSNSINHKETEAQTLRDSVQKAMNAFFAHLDGQDVTNIYDMVLSEVEIPMLETVMSYVNGNQTKAAFLLGLNRGTLRKKLKQYDLV